jgi:hypothetical protein
MMPHTKKDHLNAGHDLALVRPTVFFLRASISSCSFWAIGYFKPSFALILERLIYVKTKVVVMVRWDQLVIVKLIDDDL